MKLQSMKLSAAAREEMSKPVDVDAPRYPWGLSLSLDNDSLEKLGIDKLPALGEELMLAARVKVTNVSANDSEYGKSRSVGLQITACALEPEDDKGKRSVETALYGEG